MCVTKSLIGQVLRMEELVIEFYRVHTSIYTQSASYCSIEGYMHIMDELHAAIGCMRYVITKDVDACGSLVQ